MKHINITNWQGNITDWTKFNYIYGGLDETLADRVNLSIKGTNLRNYFRKSNNLIQLRDVAESTTGGLTYKVKDGVISVSGTPTSSRNIWLSINAVLPKNTTYYVNFFHNGDHEGNIIYNVAKELYNWTDRVYALNPSFTFQRDYTISAICIQLDANKQYNCTFKPMLVYGNVMPTTYEPYGSMVMVENVGVTKANSLNWLDSSVNLGFFQSFVSGIKKPASNADIANIALRNYKADSANNVYSGTTNKTIGVNANNGYIQIRDNDYDNATDFKNHFTDNDYIYYELAEPKITIFNQVDLGTLEWHYRAQGDPSYYDAYLSGVVNSINVSCPLYKSAWVFSTNTEDKRICTVQNAVRVRDNALEGSVIALNAKLKGVIMLYEPASSSANTLSMASPMQLDSNSEETLDKQINEESVE